MPKKSKLIKSEPDRDQDMRLKSYKDGYKDGFAAGMDDDHCIDYERAIKDPFYTKGFFDGETDGIKAFVRASRLDPADFPDDSE